MEIKTPTKSTYTLRHAAGLCSPYFPLDVELSLLPLECFRYASARWLLLFVSAATSADASTPRLAHSVVMNLITEHVDRCRSAAPPGLLQPRLSTGPGDVAAPTAASAAASWSYLHWHCVVQAFCLALNRGLSQVSHVCKEKHGFGMNTSTNFNVLHQDRVNRDVYRRPRGWATCVGTKNQTYRAPSNGASDSSFKTRS